MRALATQVIPQASEAKDLDDRIKHLVYRSQETRLELGELLHKVRIGLLYRVLGFRWFKDYIDSRDISVSYAERVMRAYKYFQQEPKFNGMSVDRILFVVNVSSRPNNGKTLDQWIAFSKTHTKNQCLEEKKRLTRKGVLPASGHGRTQAIEKATTEVPIELTIRLPPRTHRLFKEQCQKWSMSAAATILKLLVQAKSPTNHDL